MVKKRRKKKNGTWVYISLVVAALFVGIASLALFQTLNRFVGDMLLKVGIENFYTQNLTLILIVGIILFLIGFGIKKSFEKIVRIR